jgi:hypothetical protein
MAAKLSVVTDQQPAVKPPRKLGRHGGQLWKTVMNEYQIDDDRTLPFQLSRGCTDKCTFCSEWSFWRHYRRDTVLHIVDQVEELIARGCRLAVVKQGGDGVLVATAGGCELVPGLRVPVVCGLGAGDAFGGALCHGLLAGWPPAECVRFANGAGAIVASRLLCADAMPAEAEVRALLTEAIA